jgi:hypothetical protein
MPQRDHPRELAHAQGPRHGALPSRLAAVLSPRVVCQRGRSTEPGAAVRAPHAGRSARQFPEGTGPRSRADGTSRAPEGGEPGGLPAFRQPLDGTALWGSFRSGTERAAQASTTIRQQRATVVLGIEGALPRCYRPGAVLQHPSGRLICWLAPEQSRTAAGLQGRVLPATNHATVGSTGRRLAQSRKRRSRDHAGATASPQTAGLPSLCAEASGGILAAPCGLISRSVFPPAFLDDPPETADQ